jgi:hypothetical protein
VVEAAPRASVGERLQNLTLLFDRACISFSKRCATVVCSLSRRLIHPTSPGIRLSDWPAASQLQPQFRSGKSALRQPKRHSVAVVGRPDCGEYPHLETNHKKPSRPCSPLLTDAAVGHRVVTDGYTSQRNDRRLVYASHLPGT